MNQSFIRIKTGAYRTTDVSNQVFQLVEQYKLTAKGGYVTVKNSGKFPGMPEDINHGAFDLLFLSDVYLAGGYGLDDSHMMKFANTIWLLMRKDDNQFSFRVDGTGKMEPFTSANYLFFARWQPGIYTALADTVSKRKNINPGKIARMLFYKQWLQSKLQSTQKVSEPSAKQ